MKMVKTNQVEATIGSSGRSEKRYLPFDNMEAISSGVQARLEEKTSFSRKVTDETIDTARALGVADSVIERWAAQRLNRIAQEKARLQEIKSLLNRIYRERPNIAAGERA